VQSSVAVQGPEVIHLSPHPEGRRLRRVSKDEGPSVASWFETAQGRLLTMRLKDSKG
jgi:hypothetical protein